MNYQRKASAGKLNEQDETNARELLKDVQRVLKPVKVINPYAEYLELPQSVFKPRRTNSHYLQFIEAITFYKQWQRHQQVNEDTGEVFIETTIEDIQEANELIQEVLLRKSDTITGACRNHLERLKIYLQEHNQTTFTNAEIRRELHTKASTLRRYHYQLLEEGYIKKVKGKKGQIYHYEILNMEEYTTLKASINNALQQAILNIQT